MMKNLKKPLITLFFLTPMLSFAQTFGLDQAANNLWDEIKGAAPIILAVIFLVSCLMNIGKVMGDNRDWKAFIIGVAMFFFAILLIVAVITYILTLSF